MIMEYKKLNLNKIPKNGSLDEEILVNMWGVIIDSLSKEEIDAIKNKYKEYRNKQNNKTLLSEPYYFWFLKKIMFNINLDD